MGAWQGVTLQQGLMNTTFYGSGKIAFFYISFVPTITASIYMYTVCFSYFFFSHQLLFFADKHTYMYYSCVHYMYHQNKDHFCQTLAFLSFSFVTLMSMFCVDKVQFWKTGVRPNQPIFKIWPTHSMNACLCLSALLCSIQ